MTTRGRIGSMIRDKYRVDSLLATGSMASVYAATHRNGSRVALKVLHRELAVDPQMRARFKREGWFANSIGHRGVARAIDDDVTDDGCPFIVMELLEGEDLETRRKRLGGRIPLGEVLSVADSVLDVLAAAHAKDVLHRDLKPENVFVTRDGEVKLLDFGVARWNDGKDSSDVTGVGMVLGTPAFMPPEQALGRREDVDARSDLWALGATLFAMVTGEPVHAGGSAKSKLIATARTPARKLRDVAPNVPRAVASVIDRALEFERRDRWDDANAMREALRWARMALDEEAAVNTSSIPDLAIAPPVPTRRAPTDEEVTVMRDFSRTDEVYTSAPPITLRDIPASAAASSEGPIFALERRPGPEDDAPPVTERFSDKPTPVGGVALPPLVDEPPVSSEQVPVEYARALNALPPRQRDTLPLGGPSVPVLTSAPPPPPPAPLPGSLVAQVAPEPSGAARVVLPLVLVAMLGGTFGFLMLKKRSADSQAASPPTPTTATTAATADAAPPIASSDPPPSAPATSTVSAPAVASATAIATATAPKHRPRARPATTPAASTAAAPSATPSDAPAVTTGTATGTASAAAVPAPEPSPAPSPTPAPEESP